MKFKEIEFKYNANIGLKEFTTLCDKLAPKSSLIASGYDHFYSNPNTPDSFWRHRIGHDFNQLTFKKKLTTNNNYIRTEINANFDSKMKQTDVEGLIGAFDYVYNTSLFKNCFIYTYQDHILVYYVVYDTDMNEIGRFLEIELDEDTLFPSEEAAWERLVELEKIYLPLGITPHNRIKRSLYEMFKA